jgi:hypothetical protein
VIGESLFVLIILFTP